MRFLGVDPASKKCGYGCIDVSGAIATFVDAGVLIARDRDPPYVRIHEIGRDLEAVIADLKPDHAGIEAGFVQSRKGALTLGGARCVVAYVLLRAGIDVREYAPSTVKLSATGDGSAEKAAVAMAVAQRLGMRTVPGPDAGDALAVALCRAYDLS